MSRFLTERNRLIVSGAVGLLLLVAVTTIGVKASFGAFDGGYELHGDFAAAGQGLLEGSDVKIRGVNVGEVADIELVDNRAHITLRIEDDTQVPVGVQAVIRPKTLFGEKFVDLVPGENETTGPYLDPGDEIEDTLGGFELERVLTDAYPVLEAINPAELAVVLDELATAGDGLGENINRSIVNGALLADLGVSNDAEFRQFTSDLALLAEELDRLSPALVAGARDLNVALPALADRPERLNQALLDLARLSGDVADLLEKNEPFTTNALTNGARTLSVLHEHRGQLQPLLLGLTQYSKTLAEAIRVEVGDGTLMAAVKNLVPVGGHLPVALPDGDTGTLLPLPELPLPLPESPLPLPQLPLVPDDSTEPSDSDDSLLDLLLGGAG